MEYEILLKKAYKEIKPIESTGARFEIPPVKIHFEGNKTIITNFLSIASTLRRDPNHLLKFLQKELASAGIIQNERLILNRKISASKIDDKINAYTNEFVICPECKKPDTEIIKKDKLLTMHCLACGARRSLRSKI